ncbi:MAG: hypothetical protein LBG73_11495 [Spirochaetaceae bacterium]|jgi:hypothetical protein|nr:hypothetical protein [Spirochaetaceae bacterium]
MGSSKPSGGSHPVYHDDPEARRRQQDAHEREMKRLEEAHLQQMKVLQETLAQTTAALSKVTDAKNIAEQRYEPAKATIQDTRDMHRRLEKQRDAFKPTASKLEASIHECAQTGFNIILGEVENIKIASGLSIETSGIKRKIDSFTRQIEGSITGALNRRVAMSDPQCAEIMEIEAVDERERRLGAFLNQAVQESIRQSEAVLEEKMSEALAEVSDTVINKLNDKRQELGRAVEELKSLEKALSESEILENKKRCQKRIDELNAFLTECAGIIVAPV